MESIQETNDLLKTMLDGGVQDAYKRPWHRLERGLRLNRLRAYIEKIAPEHKMTDKDKKAIFLFFQKALDDKLLNTLKIVQYDPENQHIISIKGLEIKRNAEGVLVWALIAKAKKTEKMGPHSKPAVAVTRRKKDKIPI
jgi:hypothetical protein